MNIVRLNPKAAVIRWGKRGYATGQSRFARYWLHLFFLALMMAWPTEPCLAQRWPTEVDPKVDLKIALPTLPKAPIEFSTLTISYSVLLSPGAGGAKPVVDLLVCGTVNGKSIGKCDAYDRVQPTWQSPGLSKLNLQLPMAGSVALGVRVCTRVRSIRPTNICGKQLAFQESPIPVAARYTINLDSYTILHTRARITDTLYLALGGYATGQNRDLLDSCWNFTKPPTAEEPVLCKGPVPVGDRRNGTFDTRDMAVGTFDLVPGAGGSLTFAFVVFNFGYPAYPSILNIKTEMQGRIPAAIKSQVLSWHTLPAANFTGDLNDGLWLGCDGPTVAGAVRLFNSGGVNSLDMKTRAMGSYSSYSQIFTVKSQVGCGASSQYRVKWTVRRTSWH
jgi:hypothetical protein